MFADVMTTNANSNSETSTSTTSHAAKQRYVMVVAIEPSEASDAVLPVAFEYAQKLAGGVVGNSSSAMDLHLVSVVQYSKIPPAGPVVPAVGDMLREARAYLDDAVHVAAERCLSNVTVIGHLALGDPAARILDLATDVEADLIVVGTHGRGTIARIVLGSVSQRVSTSARCPVVLARTKSYEAAPPIEPPCPSCLETQKRTNGDMLWCTQHSTHHPHGRLHYETPATFAVGSMLIRPNQ